jgi:hypothetical protein
MAAVRGQVHLGASSVVAWLCRTVLPCKLGTNPCRTMPSCQSKRPAVPSKNDVGEQEPSALPQTCPHALLAAAGIPEAYYRTGELCGWCVRVACIDTACTDALLRSDLFMIADSCKDCKGDSLLISAKGIQNITGGARVLRPGAMQRGRDSSSYWAVQGGLHACIMPLAAMPAVSASSMSSLPVQYMPSKLAQPCASLVSEVACEFLVSLWRVSGLHILYYVKP